MKIFLSYRRNDQVAAALLVALHDRICDRFGRENVFRDIDSIPLGVDFRKHIASKIGESNACLVVIGSQWLDILSNPKHSGPDFVKFEIEEALRRNIPVIPILVGDATMPSESSLPFEIKALAWRNGLPVNPGRDFSSQADTLIRELDRIAGGPVAIQSTGAQSVRSLPTETSLFGFRRALRTNWVFSAFVHSFLLGIFMYAIMGGAIILPLLGRPRDFHPLWRRISFWTTIVFLLTLGIAVILNPDGQRTNFSSPALAVTCLVAVTNSLIYSCCGVWIMYFRWLRKG